jgi:hypothetical protein
VLEVGIDRQRPAIGFERVLVVAEFLEDEAEPEPRADLWRAGAVMALLEATGVVAKLQG